MTLPTSHRVVELTAHEPPALRVVEKPLRPPNRGEVVVKMRAAPINPSDLMFLKGRYGVRKPLPCVPGFEGTGVVVAGAGIGRALVGRRVACTAMEDGDGTWAEYLVTKAARCVPLRPKLDDDQGATLLVNPLTAWVLFDKARRGKHRAAVQTAAASALGHMLLRLSLKHRYPMVHLVRREAQAEELRSLGARHVIDTSAADADAQMKKTFRELGATICFDAVAGDLTDRLLSALPRHSRVVVYGALSEAISPVNPSTLIFGDKAVEGFWLADWMARARNVDRARAAVAVQRMPELKSDVRAHVPLADAPRAVADYAANMTGGKVLLTP